MRTEAPVSQPTQAALFQLSSLLGEHWQSFDITYPRAGGAIAEARGTTAYFCILIPSDGRVQARYIARGDNTPTILPARTPLRAIAAAVDTWLQNT